MKIFINQDSRKFVASEKFNAAVPRFDFKRGDTSKIELGYVQNNQLVQLVGNFTIVFGIKEDGKFDGDFLVYEAVFVYNSATGFYEGEPNFNTIELNSLLGADDGDPNNDIPFVDCLFEISATDDNGIASSNTSVARVYHDVNKGNEGIPTGANPSYSVVGHTHPAYEASITALEDRDWVSLTSNSIDGTENASSYQSGVVSVMRVTGNLTYPEEYGTVITDYRTIYCTQTFISIGLPSSSYTRFITTVDVRPWQKVIQSENGTITDDLELAGTTYTAPNLDTASDPDSLITLKDTAVTDFETVTSTGSTSKSLEIVQVSTSNITRTLPTAASSIGRRYKYVLSNSGVTNYARVEVQSGESLEGQVDGYKTLSSNGDHVEIFSDGVSWYVLNDERVAYASLNVTADTTQNLNATPAQITTWDAAEVEAPGRIEANGLTGVEVMEQAVPFQVYEVNCLMICESDADDLLAFEIRVNGLPTGIKGGVEIGGKGGAQTSVAFFGFIPANDGDILSVYGINDAAGTVTFRDGCILVVRRLTK